MKLIKSGVDRRKYILLVFVLAFSVWFMFFDRFHLGWAEGVLFLFYVTSIFLVNAPRDREVLEKFLRSINHIRKYLFAGFALITAILLGLVSKTSQELFVEVILWYIILFFIINLIIWMPTFNIMYDNPNSIFARVYFVLSAFLFDWLILDLTDKIGASDWIVSSQEALIHNFVFGLLGVVELLVGVFLIWYLFKVEKEKIG